MFPVCVKSKVLFLLFSSWFMLNYWNDLSKSKVKSEGNTPPLHKKHIDKSKATKSVETTNLLLNNTGILFLESKTYITLSLWNFSSNFFKISSASKRASRFVFPSINALSILVQWMAKHANYFFSVCDWLFVLLLISFTQETCKRERILRFSEPYDDGGGGICDVMM